MSARVKHEAQPSRRVVRGLFALALGAASACTPAHGAAFLHAMREADDASQRADYRRAVADFDHAAEVALLPRDRDEARHAAAMMLARAGDVSLAIARLDVLARETPPGPEAAAALYDKAALELGAGDAASGWRDIEAMIHLFPNDGDARPALHRWLVHEDEMGGPEATLTWLRRAQPGLDSTDRSEEVAHEIALRLERTGDAAHARDAFVAVAARWPYPQGALWDDALFHASTLDEASGHPAEAARDLEQMLSRRERAILVGSAERARYAPSQLHLGELYRDRLGDHAAARAAFHKLYADYPESTLRDRGLYEEAELLLKDGDSASACGRFETLVRDFPASRYAACAALRCPAMHVAPGPEAPKTCHAYINAAKPVSGAP